MHNFMLREIFTYAPHSEQCCVVAVICWKQPTGWKQLYTTNICHICWKQHTDTVCFQFVCFKVSWSQLETVGVSNLIPCETLLTFSIKCLPWHVLCCSINTEQSPLLGTDSRTWTDPDIQTHVDQTGSRDKSDTHNRQNSSTENSKPSPAVAYFLQQANNHSNKTTPHISATSHIGPNIFKPPHQG